MADDNFVATQVAGGVLHYADKQREVGVAGVGVAQTWDLTVFPVEIRKDPAFRAQLIAIFQSFDGITKVANEQILPAAPALPQQLQVEIDAVLVSDKVDLFLTLPHSGIR